MPRTDTPTHTDFETAYHEAMSLTDPLEIIRGVVTVYVPARSCFLTDEEQADGFTMYASRLSAFNRRGGYEVAIDRAGTYRERWLAWLIADRLPGLVGLAIPRRDTLEETRKELEAAAAAHYITVRRAEAERVRAVGGDHREEAAPEAPQAARAARANTKRRARKGEADTLTAAALLAHHHDENGNVTYNPVTNRGLAEMAGVANGTASAFMRKHFARGGKSGHDAYVSMCDHHRGELRSILETFDIPDAGSGGKKAAKKKNYLEETDEQFAHACRAGSVSYGGQERDDFDDEFPEL